MSGLEILLAAAGGGLELFNRIATTEAAAGMSEAQAAIARQQAERERRLAAQEAADLRREQRRRLAALRARRAGTGVALQGSPLLLEEAAAGDIELGAQRRLDAGRARTLDLRRRSALLRQEATNRRRKDYLGLGSTLLTDLSTIDFGD